MKLNVFGGLGFLIGERVPMKDLLKTMPDWKHVEI